MSGEIEIDVVLHDGLHPDGHYLAVHHEWEVPPGAQLSAIGVGEGETLRLKIDVYDMGDKP